MSSLIPRSDAGSILVGVLWIQVILTVIVVGLLHSTRVDLHVSKAQSDKVKAYYLALAGAEKAKAVLYQSRKQRMEEDINHKNDIYRDVEQFKETEFGGGQFRVGYLDPEATTDTFVYGLIDLEQFLNINSVSVDELNKLPNFDQTLGPLLKDYLDGDSEVTQGGFELPEDEDGGAEGYFPKNAPLTSLTEVLIIPGADPLLFYGEDANLNGVLDPNEDDGSLGFPLDNQDGQLIRGWAQYMTVFSGIENVDAKGNARINIQGGGAEELITLPGVSEELANQIIAFREENEFNSISDIMGVRAMRQNNNDDDDDDRRNSRNRGGGNRGGNSRGGSTPTGGSLISQSAFLEMADNITVGEGGDEDGPQERENAPVININSASRNVLEVLPGLNRELADAIIRERNSSGYFKSKAHILNVPGITTEIFKGLEKRISARSETFKIISEGMIPSSNVTHRLETIIRVDSGDMTTISFRNL